MSTSPTSKPASPTSPAGGDETEDAADTSDAAKRERVEIPDEVDEVDDKAKPKETPKAKRALVRHDIEVELEVSRRKSLFSGVGGIAGGILLILNLGTVGVWAGFALVAWGLYHVVRLAMTLMNPPGAIVVRDGRVELPRGPHRGNPVVTEPSAVTAVYMLRRSVPWNTSSPVLVVELGSRAFVYPRDWFASEAEQRRVLNALVARRELPEST